MKQTMGNGINIGWIGCPPIRAVLRGWQCGPSFPVAKAFLLLFLGIDAAELGAVPAQRAVPPAYVTRHTVFPTSSATIRAPVRSTATPTGRPRASPFWLRKPATN